MKNPVRSGGIVDKVNAFITFDNEYNVFNTS